MRSKFGKFAIDACESTVQCNDCNCSFTLVKQGKKWTLTLQIPRFGVLVLKYATNVSLP